MKEQGDLLMVDVPDTKTQKARRFVIAEDYVAPVKKYKGLRPKNVATDRFFLNYKQGKCTAQIIGKHKFASIPQEIARYLNIIDPENYTGHAFRRTSATLLADAGANMTTMKRHGGWKSSSVAEGYIEESLQNKTKIGKLISSTVTSSVNKPREIMHCEKQPEKRQIMDDISIRTLNTKKQIINSEMLNTSPNSKGIIFNNCSIVFNCGSKQQ